MAEISEVVVADDESLDDRAERSLPQEREVVAAHVQGVESRNHLHKVHISQQVLTEVQPVQTLQLVDDLPVDGLHQIA